MSAAGEVVGLVGESGSGKSVTGLSILGLVDPPGRIVGGSVKLAGQELVGLAPRKAARAARTAPRDGVPGPDERAQSGAHHRDADAPRAGGARARLERSRARALDRGAHRRAHPRRRATARCLSASVLRRHAPARRDRDRVAAQAGADRVRRADHRARRIDPGADPDRDARPRARSRDGADLDQPRSRDRLLAREPHPGDVRGPHHRGGADRRGAAQSAPSLQPRASSIAALARRAGPRSRANSGLHAVAAPPSGRLRVPAALPGSNRHVPPAARCSSATACAPTAATIRSRRKSHERAGRGARRLEAVRAAPLARREDRGIARQRDRDAHRARARPRFTLDRVPARSSASSANPAAENRRSAASSPASCHRHPERRASPASRS